MIREKSVNFILSQGKLIFPSSLGACSHLGPLIAFDTKWERILISWSTVIMWVS